VTFDQVVTFVDEVADVLTDRRVVAWRLLARAYVVAPGLGPRQRGEGAVIGASLRDGRSGVLTVSRLDTTDVESWMSTLPRRRGPPWESSFEDAVLLAGSTGCATLPASDQLLALVDDESRVRRLFALERAVRASLAHATNLHAEVSSSVVVERRVCLGSTAGRSDTLTASIQLDFSFRRDAAPHRLYGEELTAADLHDWTLVTRQLAWFPDPEALGALVTDVVSRLGESS
jgi:hypothetical protein